MPTKAGIKTTEEEEMTSDLCEHTQVFVLVGCTLTLEHPVQVIKGFVDV